MKQKIEKTQLDSYEHENDFSPLGDRVIVEFINSEEKTLGTIIIAESKQERPTTAVIRAISTTIDKTKYTFKVGDVVMFGDSAYTAATQGGSITLDGKKLHILNVTAIFGFYKGLQETE